MKRIESLGGPLILLPESCVPAWRGHVEDSEVDDYWRASASSEYISSINVGAGFGLALGDSPDSTAILPVDLGLGLHRWVCADSDEHMEAALRASFPGAQLEEDMLFSFTGEKYVLFDSVHSGSEFEDFLEITPPPGDYRILTLRCRAPRAESLVHLFKPRTEVV